MSLVELIGFVISMAALIFLSIRRKMDERRREEHPEEYEKEREREQQEYRELLQRLDLPIPEELLDSQPSAPPRKIAKEQAPKPSKALSAPKRTVRNFKFQASLDSRKHSSRIDDRRLKSAIEARQQQFKQTVVSEALQPEATVDPYVEQKIAASSTKKLLSGLKKPIHMVIYHEILSKPKALQKNDSLW